MNARRVLLVAALALALVLGFSVVAAASPPAAPLAVPASEGALITATGTAVVASSADGAFVGPQTLNIAAQSKATADDLTVAVTEMQQRLGAIRSALVKVGIPAEHIRFNAMNVMPQYGPPQPGQPSPVEKGQPLPQQITSFAISASLQADISDVTLLVPAMNAATANGATQVNAGGGKGSPDLATRPPDDALAKATSDAIASARQVAQAMATASGKRLGAIHSVSANQLYPACCGGAPGWTLAVTVSFDISQ